jgi:hypothetical protein
MRALFAADEARLKEENPLRLQWLSEAKRLSATPGFVQPMGAAWNEEYFRYHAERAAQGSSVSPAM